MNTHDLLTKLEPSDLVLQATPLVMWELGIVNNIDDIARYMLRGGPQLQASARPPKNSMSLIVDERPEKKYWTMVKEELTIFFCKDDDKYKELWSRIGAQEAKGTSAIVLLVSGFLGEKFGLHASVLAGFVAVFFYGVLKIGKEAYCRLALAKDENTN